MHLLLLFLVMLETKDTECDVVVDDTVSINIDLNTSVDYCTDLICW